MLEGQPVDPLRFTQLPVFHETLKVTPQVILQTREGGWLRKLPAGFLEAVPLQIMDVHFGSLSAMKYVLAVSGGLRSGPHEALTLDNGMELCIQSNE